MLVRFIIEGGHEIGRLASLWRIVCAMCMYGTGEMKPLRAPSLASVSASSLPNMPTCAQTFCIIVLCWVHVMRYIVETMRNLSR